VRSRVYVALSGCAVLITAAIMVSGGSAATALSLSGAGSSFVYPLVSAWMQPYDQAHGVTLQYDPVGSGEGVTSITARTVDFGATDAPLTPAQRAACNGCLQIPWALSATAVAYNVPGVRSGLHLSGPVIAQIFLGIVTKWNAPAIRKLNPGLTLPDLAITPVHRSDASGTSYSFSQYLAAVSPAAHTRIGVGTLPNWPTGQGARGSSGVAASVASTSGAVTYVDVAYALQNRIKFASVSNAAGQWTLPGLPAISAAAATIKTVPLSGQLTIVSPPKTATAAYPIATFTYVIVPSASAKAKLLRTFVYWSVTEGQKFGPPLLFQPVPRVVQAFAYQQISKIQVATP